MTALHRSWSKCLQMLAGNREKPRRIRDNSRFSQNVIFSGRAPGISALTERGIAAGTAGGLIAGLAQSRRRPAEAALLVAHAGRRRAAVGRRGVLAVRIVERAFGAPDDVRRQWSRRITARGVECCLVQGERAGRLEEPERI